jgi:hypothetical protein
MVFFSRLRQSQAVYRQRGTGIMWRRFIVSRTRKLFRGTAPSAFFCVGETAGKGARKALYPAKKQIPCAVCKFFMNALDEAVYLCYKIVSTREHRVPTKINM